MPTELLSRTPFSLTNHITIPSETFLLIAGPCAVESYDILFETATNLIELSRKLGIALLFKASFDKANRTSHESFRSLGIDIALEHLERIRSVLKVPVLTDIHEPYQAQLVSQVVDVIQIPAFLCRQTDLLFAAAATGLPVNIKKGQFMAPHEMQHVVAKVNAAGNSRVFLTERGTSFGYNNLVVDFRGIEIMQEFAPVVFDVTHSLQLPGGRDRSTGGQRRFARVLARAAAAAGADGFFIETHPDPSKALSDAETMIPLQHLPRLLEELLAIHNVLKFTKRMESISTLGVQS